LGDTQTGGAIARSIGAGELTVISAAPVFRFRRVRHSAGGERCCTPLAIRTISGGHAGAVRWVFHDGEAGYSNSHDGSERR
jgi:hypothetical protein